MPPRKRKAPAKLQAIAESPVKDEEEAVQQPEVNAPTDLLRQIDDQGKCFAALNVLCRLQCLYR